MEKRVITEKSGRQGARNTEAALTTATLKRRVSMATEDSSNTSLTSQLTAEALTALTGRLVSHADGIENIAAQAMATDMRLAAQAIEHLWHPKEPADLFVNVYENVDAEPVLSSVPLREVIGDDAEEYDDCRRTL